MNSKKETQTKVREPKFPNAVFDYRNMEDVGKYRGVGQAGKIGFKQSSGIDPMPSNPSNHPVPR